MHRLKFLLHKASCFCLLSMQISLSLVGPSSATAEDLPVSAKEAAFRLVAEDNTQRVDSMQKQLVTMEQLATALKERAAITKWVREQTSFVPYTGLLRGAPGVLDDRLGNSLDRSVFLATLLRLTGKEVRLIRAEVSQAQAEAILALASRGRADKAFEEDVSSIEKLVQAQPVEQRDVLAKWVSEQTSHYKKAVASQRGALFDLTEELSGALRSATQQSVAEKKQTLAALRSQSVASTRDHWWVQVREGSGWIDCDTTLDVDGKNRSSVYKTFALDSIPDNLVHGVKLRLVAQIENEQHQIREAALLSRHWRAGGASEIRGTISHMPRDPYSEDLQKKLESGTYSASEILQAHASWAPMIAIDNHFTADSFVDLDGSITEVDEGILQSLLSAGKGIGGAGLRAVDTSTRLLEGLGAEETTGAVQKKERLVGERFEIEFSVPGLPPRTEVRPLFRVQYSEILDTQDADTVLTALAGNFSFVINFASPDPVRTEMALSKGAAAAAGLYSSVIAQKELAQDAVDEVLHFEPSFLSYARMRWGAHDLSSRLYTAQPQMTGLWQRLERAGSAFKLVRDFDIIAHDVAVRPSEGIQPFELRLTQGVGETVAELLSHGDDNAVVRNAAKSLRADRSGGRAWKIYTSEDAQFTALPSATREVLSREFKNGRLVYAPVAVNAAEPLYYFRVDPQSGEVLGIGPTGRGTSSVEKLILLGNLVVCYEQALRPFAQSLLGVRHPADRSYFAGGLAFPFCTVGAIAGFGGRAAFGFGVALIGTLISTVPEYLPE